MRIRFLVVIKRRFGWQFDGFWQPNVWVLILSKRLTVNEKVNPIFTTCKNNFLMVKIIKSFLSWKPPKLMSCSGSSVIICLWNPTAKTWLSGSNSVWAETRLRTESSFTSPFLEQTNLDQALTLSYPDRLTNQRSNLALSLFLILQHQLLPRKLHKSCL